jgi:hypothetical protein
VKKLLCTLQHAYEELLKDRGNSTQEVPTLRICHCIPTKCNPCRHGVSCEIVITVWDIVFEYSDQRVTLNLLTH